jgi:hypothetical protein
MMCHYLCASLSRLAAIGGCLVLEGRCQALIDAGVAEAWNQETTR